MREGLSALFELAPDLEIVGEAERADQLRSLVEATACDILLLDLQMDRWVMDDIPALATLTKVVVLTGSENEEDTVAALQRGARAIVQKSFAAETLKGAIRAVADNMVWMPPGLQERLASRSRAATVDVLTPRESEIAGYVATGMRNAEVARKLSLSEGTVKIHLNNIFKKLNIRDRVELTLYAIRARLIGPRDRR